jgi:hypothetical protein
MNFEDWIIGSSKVKGDLNELPRTLKDLRELTGMALNSPKKLRATCRSNTYMDVRTHLQFFLVADLTKMTSDVG